MAFSLVEMYFIFNRYLRAVDDYQSKKSCIIVFRYGFVELIDKGERSRKIGFENRNVDK